jgi:hypothetical protein
MRTVVVLHELYGCDTGCCGHVVRFSDEDDGPRRFDFSHADGQSDEDLKKYAEDLIRQELGEEHVKDLDFANSKIYDYSAC